MLILRALSGSSLGEKTFATEEVALRNGLS